MKTLTLLRHAKSEADSPGGDFERPLNERGRADCRRIGTQIRELGLDYDWVLASPAQRVVETVAEVGDLLPRFDRRMYNAAPEQLLEIVQQCDDSIERLLLVGHNPGIEQLATRLTGNAVDDFPTATLVEIELAEEHWRDVGQSSRRLVRLISPKDLA